MASNSPPDTEPGRAGDVDSSGSPVGQLPPNSAHSPLPAETADTPDLDAFAPMEDDLKTRKENKLKDFSSEEILEALVGRYKLYKCVCGAIFKDDILYYLHRGSHHDEDPLKCSQCKEKMKDWYAFQTHFFQHKRKPDDS